MTLDRLVAYRASLRPASTASAPELPMNTRAGAIGAMRASSAAAWA